MSSYIHFHTIFNTGVSYKIRPFGVNAMVRSWTKDKGAELNFLEPGGISYGYWGCAAGKAKTSATTELGKIKMKEMTCAELVKEVAKIIYFMTRSRTRCSSWSCPG